MANKTNLIHFTSDQDRKKAAENGRKGGIASGKARREKKKFKALIDYYLSLPIKDRKTFNDLLALGIDPDDINNQMLLIVSLGEQAIKGSAKAARLLLNVVGEDPKDKSEDQVIIVDDIS